MKSLAEFLALSKENEKLGQQIRNAETEPELQKLLFSPESWLAVIRLAEHDQGIRRLCAAAVLEPSWSIFLEDFFQNREWKIQILPHMNCFEEVMGWFYFSIYNEYNLNEEAYLTLPYLQKARDWGSIQAQLELNKIALKEKNPIFKQAKIKREIENTKKFIAKHDSVAKTLLADLCYELFKLEAKVEIFSQATAYLQQVVADAPQQQSLIDHGSMGKGYTEINHRRFADPVTHLATIVDEANVQSLPNKGPGRSPNR